MKFGVYVKVKSSGRGEGGGIGEYYQFMTLARDHFTREHVVIYIPLRIEPKWAGTIRPCSISRKLFEEMFAYVGEGLPE